MLPATARQIRGPAYPHLAPWSLLNGTLSNRNALDRFNRARFSIDLCLVISRPRRYLRHRFQDGTLATLDKEIGPSRTLNYLYQEPVRAMLLAALFLGERLSLVHAIGGICALGGAALVKRSARVATASMILPARIHPRTASCAGNRTAAHWKSAE